MHLTIMFLFIGQLKSMVKCSLKVSVLLKIGKLKAAKVEDEGKSGVSMKYFLCLSKKSMTLVCSNYFIARIKKSSLGSPLFIVKPWTVKIEIKLETLERFLKNSYLWNRAKTFYWLKIGLNLYWHAD